jgi:hypothetical protein
MKRSMFPLVIALSVILLTLQRHNAFKFPSPSVKVPLGITQRQLGTSLKISTIEPPSVTQKSATNGDAGKKSARPSSEATLSFEPVINDITF